MKHKKYSSVLQKLLCFLLVLLLNACNNEGKNKPADDTPTSGTIHISVDESFKPIIDEQIKVYEASYPGTRIIAHYKPEAECFRDLYSDTANRMIIVTRGLNTKEDRFYNDSLSYSPVSDKIASDAISIVVNKNSNDTLFTIEGLKKLLAGEMGKNRSVVFDGLNATSTVRFAIDSILKGQKFDTAVVKAVKNSQEVLDYIANSQDAIGLVGISWIGNPEDTAQVNMLKKVKIGYVQCSICKDSPYIKPTQYSIQTRRYPLVRGLYYILKENYSGLGSGFASFMKYERGQLIFRRAYLAPVMDFDIRNVKVNEKLKKE
ncbi:substrate-binding domain-containing protein [Ferruginibacter lapsinanis]|uniref:PstS family phosphate ABC transporter substrate-binding protein n=1 Tax=Ferruginibacter lapsinanis TaxID=563172 RepID=UPI001E380E18|nr:substrate-binding domain-containing protein [Ferruginibacter lapsinanis]UEG50022.1 substrate-binding domain-containing protein [Ferruginibacter lapsinanis]